MKIATIGIDLAKEVFQIHGVNENSKSMLRKQLRRNAMTKFFANLAPCLIGMEACSSSHYWARKLGEFGHTVKFMSPQYAICANQECRATSNSFSASRQTRFGKGQNGTDKPDTRFAL